MSQPLYIVNLVKRVALHHGYARGLGSARPSIEHRRADLPLEAAALDAFLIRSMGDEVVILPEYALDDPRFDGLTYVFGDEDWLDRDEAGITVSWQTFSRDPDRYMLAAQA